jgi:hypothetical protein
MGTEVHKQVVDELQRLNARVSELEGMYDTFKAYAQKAKDTLMGGHGELTQANIVKVLSEFDQHVFASENHFGFALRGVKCGLVWDKDSAEAPLHLEIGDDSMSIHSLKELHDMLAVKQKNGMHAPADLQACTSAVLRQQARSGLGLRRGPT